MIVSNIARALFPLALGTLVCAVRPAAGAVEHHDHQAPHVRRHHAHGRLHTQRGLASYFARSHAGETTASGKPLHPDKMVAASKTLPLGTKAKVTDLDTGKSVKVTVVDRGPYARRRIIDVSPRAAKSLGMTHDGVDPVKVKPLAEPQHTR